MKDYLKIIKPYQCVIIFCLIVISVSLVIFDKDGYTAKYLKENTSINKNINLVYNYEDYVKKYNLKSKDCKDKFFNNLKEYTPEELVSMHYGYFTPDAFQNWIKDNPKTYKVLLDNYDLNKKLKKIFNKCITVKNIEVSIAVTIIELLNKKTPQKIIDFNNGKDFICKNLYNEEVKVNNKLGYKEADKQFFYKSEIDMFQIIYCNLK